MSDNDNRTLLLDMLRPYRKAVSTSTLKASVSSAAAKLNFSNASVSEGFAKRKSSFESTTTPVKRPRSDSNSSASTPAVSSPWETKRLKAELIEARGQIARLESQIQHQQVIRKETDLYFENEKKTFIEERRHREKAFSELEERLQVVRERENEGKEQLSEMTRNINELKNNMAKEKQQMQKEISELKSKVINSSIINNGQLSEMKKDIEELTQALEASQKEAENYKVGHDKAVLESERATKLQVALEKQMLVLQQTESRMRELESDKESYREWLEQAKVSQKRLAAMPALERDVVSLRSELRNLRSAAHQNQMLEEQVHVLNTRLNSLQPVHQNLSDLQTKFSNVDRETEEWRAVGRQYEAETPHLLSDLVERLQQRDLTLTTLKVEADSQLSKAKDELLTTKHEWDKAQTKLNDVQNIQKTQQSLIHRIQKKLLLVSRERDSYRHQLDCYEKELTVSLAGEASVGGTGALLPGRVEALEKSLQGYRDLVAKMEQDMLACRADSTPALQDQLIRLKDEVENLKKDNGMLRSRKDELELQLECRALKGDYDPTKTKIVHLTQNPASKAQEDFRHDLDKAYAEILELRRKIKRLEQNELEMTQKLSETIREGNTVTMQDIEQLKSELESNKLKAQRVKEALVSSLQEYRDVCYMLMGYKLDRTSPNNYRLLSMYADSADEYLSFKLTPDGGIEMVQTDYSTQIKDLVELHLHHQKSIPVFISALTFNLFNKTTMVTESSINE